MGQRVRLATHASVLNDLPDAELKATVARMSAAEVAEMLTVVPLTSMHRIRAELLSRMYDESIKLGRWTDAVRYLNGFSDDDILTRIKALAGSADKRRELIVAALDNPRILQQIRAATGLTIDAAQPFGTLNTAGFQPATGQTLEAGAITIAFTPDPALVRADEIAFVQTIRRVITGTDSTQRYVHGMDERATDKGTTVDRFGPKKYGYFGYENTGAPGTMVTAGWCKGDNDRNPATMTDRPDKVSDTDNTFEACVLAKAGPDTGRIYGSLTWGFTVDSNMAVTPKPVQIQLKTSSEFQAAVQNWNEQAAKSKGAQETLPPAK